MGCKEVAILPTPIGRLFISQLEARYRYTLVTGHIEALGRDGPDDV